MNVGMLWFDNDAKSDLDAKVVRASDYYKTKYGKTPTLCYVHPSMLPIQMLPGEGPENDDEKSVVVAGIIRVRGNITVLPNHFWIGVNGNCDQETG